MQVYCPRDQQPDAFHRTLFLFVCRNPACCSPNDAANFTVFRSQLPRVNQFFSADPPPDDPSEYVGVTPSAGKYQSLCVVCGCVGTKQCSQCHSANYCGKEHQSRHWKAGHKKTCGKQGSQESGDYKVQQVLHTHTHTHTYLNTLMYLWWSLYILYLWACQVKVTVGDSGFCCCTCVMSFKF